MRGIQCKKCVIFTPEWCPKKRDSLDPDLIRDCQYFRIKTNADRIRSMTDEELAHLLAQARAALNPVLDNNKTYFVKDVIKWERWLKQEAADNGDVE